MPLSYFHAALMPATITLSTCIYNFSFIFFIDIFHFQFLYATRRFHAPSEYFQISMPAIWPFNSSRQFTLMYASESIFAVLSYHKVDSTYAYVDITVTAVMYFDIRLRCFPLAAPLRRFSKMIRVCSPWFSISGSDSHMLQTCRITYFRRHFDW